MGIIIYEGRDGLSSGKVRKGDFWKLQPRRPVRGIFGYSDAGDGGGVCGRQGIVVLCSAARRNITEILLFSTEPFVFFPATSHHPKFFEPPFLCAHARGPRLAFPILYTHPKTLYFLHSPLPPTSPTPELYFCYCLFSFTRARDYLGPSVICFYRHVRTNERFNFTRVKNNEKKQKKTKRFFFNYIVILYAQVLVWSPINV